MAKKTAAEAALAGYLANLKRRDALAAVRRLDKAETERKQGEAREALAKALHAIAGTGTPAQRGERLARAFGLVK